MPVWQSPWHQLVQQFNAAANPTSLCLERLVRSPQVAVSQRWGRVEGIQRGRFDIGKKNKKIKNNNKKKWRIPGVQRLHVGSGSGPVCSARRPKSVLRLSKPKPSDWPTRHRHRHRHRHNHRRLRHRRIPVDGRLLCRKTRESGARTPPASSARPVR